LKGVVKLVEVFGFVDIEQIDCGVKVMIVFDEKGEDGEELELIVYVFLCWMCLFVMKG